MHVLAFVLWVAAFFWACESISKVQDPTVRMALAAVLIASLLGAAYIGLAIEAKVKL